jgi:hypothetical protein
MKKCILLIFAIYSSYISYSQIYNLNTLTNLQTTTACKGTFTIGTNSFACYFDPIDPGTNYGNNQNKTVTFCSGNGTPLRVSFRYWDLENNFDFLRIYNGTNASAPLLGTITGSNDIYNSGALFFTSSNPSNCLTFVFTSDGSVTGCGWEAFIGCAPASCNNNTPANDVCSSAPQICDLNGYCGNTSGWYTPDNQTDATGIGSNGSGIFCGTIENNSWISFIANATTASVTINSSNCSFNAGIQAQMFRSTNCTSFNSISNCVSQGTGVVGPFTLTSNTPLVVGTRYYIMIDGFAGNACDYTVTANTGVQVITLTSNPANGRICPGQTATINVNNAPVGTTYSWTPTTSIVGSTTSSSVTVQPTITTTYNCQITLPNGCGIQNETYTITVNPTPTTPITRNICQGQSTVFNGQTLTTAGIYRDTFLTTLNCDSFVVLTLNVNPAKTTNLPDRILCQGQSTTFNGNTITTSGIYRDTLTSLGCDSFLVLNVIVNPVKTTNQNQTICQGQSIVFNGQTITTAGTYRDTFTTSLGCDSFIVLTVTVNPNKTTPISRSICQGQSTIFNGQTITTAGTFRDTLATSLRL